AQLAAMLGLPFAFASHFAPRMMMQAIQVYRSGFRPSSRLSAPYVMLGVNVIAADTDAEARRQFTSLQQAFVNLRSGRPGPLPPPVDDLEERLAPADRLTLGEMLACSVVGGPDAVRQGLAEFVARTGADELMIASQVFDHAARLRSFEIAAAARG
ncbi:MAG TPA: LLM class flavin-dependent oxidoreductase, partial [Gemmatimonadaceae bacterium]